jgi:hypothetical protein
LHLLTKWHSVARESDVRFSSFQRFAGNVRFQTIPDILALNASVANDPKGDLGYFNYRSVTLPAY